MHNQTKHRKQQAAQDFMENTTPVCFVWKVHAKSGLKAAKHPASTLARK
jgi:hypothetical protein